VRRILVTGASSNVGGEVVSALVARGAPVRALVRRGGLTPSSLVEVATGDAASPATIGPALDGVGTVFLLGNLLTGELARRMRDAGVEHVVLLTSRCVIGGVPDNAITRMWLDAEATMRESGVAWTILRPSGFDSNALRWLPQLRQGDLVRAPWPDVPVASIAPADIAAVAVAALGETGHVGAALELSGPEPLTPAQQVATLARVLARPLRYQAQSDEEARAEMAVDTPPAVVDAFFRFFSQGEYDDSAVVDTVERITGRPPRTFEQWARDHASAFAAP
jgi:uncharacterized protein YbjT (DUF2867 family)